MGIFSSLGSLVSTLIPGAAPIAGALGGLFDSGTDMYSNYHNMQLQFEHQKQLAAQQQEYNVQNAQQQFEYNKYYQERQFQQQQQATREANEYNSPTQQMKRLGDAGINPFVALSNNLGSSGTQSSVPSGSGGSAGLPSVGLPTVPLNTYSYANSVANISSSLRNIADAKKAGVETKWLEDSMQDMLRNLKNEADQKNLQNLILKIQSSVEGKKQQLFIKQTLEQINKLVSETSLNKAKTATETDLQHMYDAQMQKFWSEHEKNIKDAELTREQILLLQKYGDARYQAEISEIKSRANYNNEQAEDLQKTRAARIQNLRADAGQKSALTRIYNSNANVLEAKEAQQIQVDFDRLFREHFFSQDFDKAMQMQLEYQYKEYKRAVENGDLRTAGEILDLVKGTIDLGIKLAK